SSICLIYLIISNGQQFILQQLAATGCSVTYLLSAYTLYQSTDIKIHSYISLLGIASCFLLLGICINNFIANGMLTLLLFSLIMGTGVILFIANKTNK